MFKKTISCMLAVVLLCTALPETVFAGEAENALQDLLNQTYIEQICAVNSNAPDWHDGMSLESANSLQMETALDSLLNEDILPTLSYLESTVRAQVATGTTGGLSDDMRQARDDCRALRDEVQAQLDIIEYERSTVPTNAGYVFDGSCQTRNEAEREAKRVLLGVERLEDSMETVSSSYPGWKDEIERLGTFVCPDDKSDSPRTMPADSLQAHIVGVRTSYMNGLLDEAKRIAEEEKAFSEETNTAPGEMEVYAVPRTKILFDVRDKDNKPLANAQVSAWNAATKEVFVGTYDKDAEGYLFTTKSLGLAEDGYLEIGYEITCSGYESHYSNFHLCQGGDIFHTVLVESGKAPYISGTAFNGEDMQWSQTDIYITDANDANQTVSVYLEQVPKGTSQTVYMFYKDQDGKDQQIQSASVLGEDGRTHADFTDQWCKILKAGEPVRFALDSGSSTPMKSLLMANKPVCSEAGVEKPSFETDNETLMARFLPSSDLLKFTIPEDVFFFGGTTIGLNFPGLQMPVTVYEGLDGDFFIMFSGGKDIKDMTDWLGKKIGGDNWKTQSQSQTDRKMNNASEKMEDNIKNGSSDFVKGDNSVKKPFLDKCTMWWNLFFAAQGQEDVDKAAKQKTVSGQVSTGFTIGVTAEFSKQVCAMPPLVLTAGVSVGAGATIYGLFNATFPSSDSFTLDKLNLSFGAVSIMIPISVYLAIGAGTQFFNTGLKGTLSFNFALPLITLDYKENVGISIDARATFYGQLLLVHFELLLARISWAFENGESGPVTGYLIGKGQLGNSNTSNGGFEMPEASASDIGLSNGLLQPEDAPLLGESDTKTTSLDLDTDVIWHYEPTSVNGSTAMKVASTLPKKFEMYNNNSVDMTIWAEDNKIMLSANGLNNAQELSIPEDPAGDDTPLALAKAGIESGEYKIIDVNANSGDSHYDYIGSYQMPVQTAVVSVTYAKSFRTEQQTFEGKTMEVNVPDETETLSMVIVLTSSSTTPLILSTDQGEPAVYFFHNTTDAIKEVYPYPCQIHLKESPEVAGQPCIDTENSYGVVTAALYEDGSLVSSYYGYAAGDYVEDCVGDTYRVLKTGTTEDIPVYIGIDESGWIICGNLANLYMQNYLDFADGKNIDDFILFDLPDTDGQIVAFYLEKTEQEGMDALKAAPMVLYGEDAYNCFFDWNHEELWDFESDVPGTQLHIDKLINNHSLNATLYWFDTGLKQLEANAEKQEIARVRGVYFDWFNRKASKPFTIATLYGNDGEIGDLLPNLGPIKSFQSGGQFYFARALEKDNQQGENDSVNWQQDEYMLYNTPVSNVVDFRVISAVPEYHAMSAGRSGNFSFTLQNVGNVPIATATMQVSRIITNPDGSETKETIAEYKLYPSDESKNSAAFWSVDSETPDIRNGIAAVHQIDTIFDSLPGDPDRYGNVSNNGSQLSKYFLPESVFAYKSSIAIPENWDGLQLLRAEVTKAYGPSTLENGETQLVMYDMENGGVYAVDESGSVSNEVLSDANGIPLQIERSAPFDMVIDTAEIGLSCKLHEKNGEKYIAAAISQKGNTAMNTSSGNITLRAYVDDETAYPAFVHTFKNHTTGDITLNLDAPISTFTGGQKAEKLTLIVSDGAEENDDLSLFNNSQVFYLSEATADDPQKDDPQKDDPQNGDHSNIGDRSDNSNRPDNGDNQPVLIWIMLLAVSAMFLMYLLIVRKRRPR